MILKALADYYQRLLNDPDIDIAPFGFENKEIPFILVIDSTGKFKNIIDTRTSQGTRQIARKFCVPKGEKKTSGIKANLLWDVPKYSLGIVTSNDEKAARKKKKIFP
jgi:CRISPR-associated protein Csd1